MPMSAAALGPAPSPSSFKALGEGTKNVVVLGGSYGGIHAATVLAQRLPPSHRVILVERNSHMNHLYVFPRFGVVPGHEHKAFIPYTDLFGKAPSRPVSRTPSPPPFSAAHPHTLSIKHSFERLAPGEVTPRMTRKGADDGKASFFGRLQRQRSKRRASARQGPAQAQGEPQQHVTYSGSASIQQVVDGHGPSLLSGSGSASSPSLRSTSDISALVSASSPSSSSSSSPSSSSSDASSEPSTSSDNPPKKTRLALSGGAQPAVAPKALLPSGDENRGERRPLMEVKQLGEARKETEAGAEIGADEQGRPRSSSSSSSSSLADVEVQVESGSGGDLQDAVEENDGGAEKVADGFEDAHPHLVLHATAKHITPTHVVVQPASPSSESESDSDSDSVRIPYTHLIYALGSHLPDPLRTEARTKKAGMEWMKECQRKVNEAGDVVIVGGGALGVEFATDIASHHGPSKRVTLIHSRKQLLPSFDPRIHDIVLSRLRELGVEVVLGERICLGREWEKDGPSGFGDGGKRKRVRTTGGKDFEADLLLLCTGQKPCSSVLASLSPSSIDPLTKLVRVSSTLQVIRSSFPSSLTELPKALPFCEAAANGGTCACACAIEESKRKELERKRAHRHRAGEEHGAADKGDDADDDEGLTLTERWPNVYAIGDCVDAFGAIKAGYQAWGMADVAAENVLRSIDREERAEVKRRERREWEEVRRKLKSGKWHADSTNGEENRHSKVGRADSAERGREGAEGSGDEEEEEEEKEEEEEEWEMAEFRPAPPMIKLSLGLGKMLYQGAPPSPGAEPEINLKDDPEDLGVEAVWRFMANAETSDMYR